MKDMDNFSLDEQKKSIFGRLEFSVAFMYVVLQPDSTPHMMSRDSDSEIANCLPTKRSYFGCHTANREVGERE